MLNAECAARNAEAKSVAFSSVSGAAANQLEGLHLTEADGCDEAPCNTSRLETILRGERHSDLACNNM